MIMREKKKEELSQINIKFLYSLDLCYSLNAKFNLPEYISFIKPQNFGTSDIKCFTVIRWCIPSPLGLSTSRRKITLIFLKYLLPFLWVEGWGVGSRGGEGEGGGGRGIEVEVGYR